MKKRFDFKPQEMISVMVEAVVSSYLIKQGLSAEESSLVGGILGGVVKGLSLPENTTYDKIFNSLKKECNSIIDSNLFEFPDLCKELFNTELLSPKKIIIFMCQKDSYHILCKQIIEICKKDPDCDIDTFPVDDFANVIIENFEKSVQENHELATYANFCMLRNNNSTPQIFTANEQYVKSFTETLFLHKDIENSKVNLKNLFVMQKFNFLKKEDSELYQLYKGTMHSLEDVIASYLTLKIPFLFIEGDAGSGKTSLVGWMNYHYEKDDSISEHLFENRQLITIRLRDLNKKCISEKNSLSLAILEYMHLSSFDELERRFPNAIMILDGFDELCMIEGIGSDHDALLYDLNRKHLEGFQFIVTTRPKFISPRIDIPSEFISLLHFDSEQRDLWLEYYTSEKRCNQKIDDLVYSYIKNIDDDSNSCICDTPMTLYMLVAKKGAYKYLENNWSLYNYIFFDSLSETEYNVMFPNPERKYNHDIIMIRDVLYQISEEIAYEMYKKENQTFYLSDKELEIIVEKIKQKNTILNKSNLQDIAKHCYALCCYWKANSERGVVEFLHNNIRDFFLAEKIYRTMNEVIQCILANKSNEPPYKQIANHLCIMFNYGVLETKVTEFLFLRAKYYAEKYELDFAKFEYDNKLIPRILLYMSRDCFEENSNLIKRPLDKNSLQTIANILTCTIQLFRHCYEGHLKDKELIHWVPESPYTNNILIPLFKSVFCHVPVTISVNDMITLGSRGFFSNLDFRNCDLRNIGFQKSVIKMSNFTDSILCGSDFSYAVLDGSDFTNADVHFACLEGASLTNCVMTGVDLRGTELPDGFISENQDEQIEHLKSLNIKGLII